MSITNIIANKEADKKIEKDVFKILKNIKKKPSSIDNILINKSYPYAETIDKYQESYYQFIFYHSILLGRQDIIDYLIQNTIHKKNMTQKVLDKSLLRFCLEENKKCVSETLDYGADIHFNNDCIFAVLYETSKEEMIQFLIFDLNIKKTKKIKEEYCDFIEEVEKMFVTRELNDQLNKDLNNKNHHVGSKKL